MNDIDLFVTLTPRAKRTEDQHALENQRIDAAHANGRRFQNLTQELGWPRTEVTQRLKNRSRALHIHDPHDGIYEQVERRTIFEAAQG